MEQSNYVTILGINFAPRTKPEILNIIKSRLTNPERFFHIVSLNPEIMVAAQEDEEFRNILNHAARSHVDGVGMQLAGLIIGKDVGQRIAGVDLMEELIRLAREQNKKILFIGGKNGVAPGLAAKYGGLGIEGIEDITRPSLQEEREIKKTVSDFQPTLVFVSFGSPQQEKWIAAHKDLFCKQVVMGVGGAFDFLSGHVKRAPRVIQQFGLEWLWRLVREPWRIKRQLRLLKFLWLVLFQK